MTTYAITGRIGAGKTAVKESFDDLNFWTIELGDVARQAAPADVDLSVWAGKQKEERGKAWAIEKALDQPYNDVYSGIRSPEEIECLREQFKDVQVIYVDASKDVRFSRLEDRDDMDRASFEERDARERDWGIGEILDRSLHDHYIYNGEVTTLHDLHQFVESIHYSNEVGQ
jgi:dephospho-CoA kinase